jgi:HlyD family secretion protein
MTRNKFLLLTFLVFTVVAATLYLFRNEISFLQSLPEESTISATGTVEVEDYNIAARVSGKILAMKAKEGDPVKRAQVLAVIEREDLKHQVEAQKAAIKAARSVLEDLLMGPRPEKIQIAEARVSSARSRYEQARRDFLRYRELFEDEVISKKELEQFRLALEVAENDLRAARSELEDLEAGTRENRIEAQREEILRLEAMLAASESIFKHTRVPCPVTGLVLSRNFDPGEFVVPGAVLYTIGDPLDCKVRIFIPSTLIGRVFHGQKAEIRVDSFPGKIFTGTVSNIAEKAEFTPRQSITPKERANMVFRVEIAVDNSDRLLKPGMPADVILK